MKNYYEILEVSSKASIEVIEKAYKTLAKKYHPDSNKSQSLEEKKIKEKKMKEINEAYAVLSNDFLKEQYDRELQNIVSDYNIYDEHIMENKKYYNKKENKVNREKKENFASTTTFDSILKICKNIFSNKPDLNKVKQMDKTDYISIGLTIIIMVVILVILWFIPFTRSFITSIIDVF